MTELKCPATESSEFLCDRVAEYQVNGTIYCGKHARRIMEGGRMREGTEPLVVAIGEELAATEPVKRGVTTDSWGVTTDGW